MNYWEQGFLILTPSVRAKPQQWREQAHKEESKRVFKNFSCFDYGKSRVLIKVCNNAKEAMELITKHNKRAEKINKGIIHLKKFYKGIKK